MSSIEIPRSLLNRVIAALNEETANTPAYDELLNDLRKHSEGYHIVGRRWFTPTHGNTYHSVTIYRDGQPVHKIPYSYGYGDQYIDTALDWLEANNRIAPRLEGPHGGKPTGTLYLRDNGHTYDVIDVKRKGDL